MALFYTLMFIACIVACNCYQEMKAVIQYLDSPQPFLALGSSYSRKFDSPLTGRLIVHESDPLGCDEWPLTTEKLINECHENNLLSIGIVDRGICPFFLKSKMAQLSKLDVLLIVSEDDSLVPLGADEKEVENFKQSLIDLTESSETTSGIIPTLMIPKSFKSSSSSDIIEISLYRSRIFDTSMIIIIFISTFLVGLGAYYSSDVERATMYNYYNNTNSDNKKNILHRQRGVIQEIDVQMAWSFIIVASSALLILYFFMSSIFLLLIIIFCIGAINGLSTIFTHLLDYIFPSLSDQDDDNNKSFKIKSLDLNMTLSDILGFLPALLLTIIWFITRKENYAWILQNIMCTGLLLNLQRNIRLTNIKIATILLGTAFIYDIFWVFISPYFFSSSVMVSVATYQHDGNERDTLPVVLKFPRIDDVFHSPMILGLGDIALPGLFISYLLRYDYLTKVGINLKNGYFIPGLIGYFIGMILTDINLIIMRSGQPALLFLVPFTLGTTIILSYKRGHLNALWNGIPKTNK